MGNNKLIELGLNDEMISIHQRLYSSLYMGRVLIEHKGLYRIATEKGEVLGKVSGKLQYEAIERDAYPAVGDWVIIDRLDNDGGDAIIQTILPRKNKFSRKMAGKRSEEQIVAVNVDTLFICMSLNNNYNLRRLERYIALAWESMTVPVILLTKADLCDDADEKYHEVLSVSIGIDVLVVSAVTGEGFEKVKEYVNPGKTIAFIGSSGVGKSTMVNLLLGYDKLQVQEVGSEDKGRHTTTHRELMLLPTGGVLLDTPGMREIHLLDGEDGVERSFADIEELSKNCRFSDCTHQSEPECAVLAAMDSGELPIKRFESYLKLKKEAEYMERKVNKSAELSYKQQMKNRHKIIRNFSKK